MPTMPDALAAKLSQALAPATRTVNGARREKSAETDFRQALAIATPKNADASKAVATQTIKAVLAPAAATQTAATVSVMPENTLKTAELIQAAGTRRVKKADSQKAAVITAKKTMPQQSAAASAIAAFTIAMAPASPVAPAPASASRPPIAPIDDTLRQASSPVSTSSPKQNAIADAPATKPAEASAVLLNSPVNPVPAVTGHPITALHAPAKTAEIFRQISDALPAGNLDKSSTNPVVHISLNPATLGTITVKIIQHASGETAVILSASQPETLAALKHDAPNLNQVLTNAGVPAANRQVDFQTIPVAAPQISTGLGGATAGQQGQNGAAGQQPQHAGTGFATSISNPATPAATLTAQPRILSRSRSGVDVIA